MGGLMGDEYEEMFKRASMMNPGSFQGDTDPLDLPSFSDKLASKLYGTEAEDAGLNPRQARAARQNALQAAAASLLQSGGRNPHRVGLGQALGGAMQAGSAGQLQGIEQQSALAAAGSKKKSEMDRKAIFMRFPPPGDQAKPEEIISWAESGVIPALINAGLVDEASKVSEIAKRLGSNTQLQAVYAGDKIYTFDPKTGKYTEGPQRGMTQDAKDLAAAKLDEQKARTRAMTTVADERNNRLQMNTFLSRNNTIRERAPMIQQALMTLDQAKQDETLTSSAIINFMQAADQKAQIRWQLLNWFKANVKQSLTGRWDMAVARNFHGKLPPDVIASMEEHLSRLQKMNADDWDLRRNGEIKRHPGLEGWLPPSSELGGWKPPAPDLSTYNFGGAPAEDAQ